MSDETPQASTESTHADEPTIAVTGDGAANAATGASAQAATADAQPGDSAPIDDQADVKPAEVENSVHPQFQDVLGALIPNATFQGEPHGDTPVKYGVFSHAITGLFGSVHSLLAAFSGRVSGNKVVSTIVATAASSEEVAKLRIDAEKLVQDQTQVALEALRKALDILHGDAQLVLTDAEIAVKDLAFGFVPESYRSIVAQTVSRLASKQVGEVVQRGSEAVVAGIQHGIFALETRLLGIAHVATIKATIPASGDAAPGTGESSAPETTASA